MTIDLTETTTGAIASALQQARQRLGGPASGMVLTLVIVTDETAQYDAVRAANEAAREHPCRVLVVITRRPTAASRLDAEIRVGETSPGETVLLRMYGPLGQHADSVVVPLLLPDTPVVTWWPGDAASGPRRRPDRGRWPSAGSPTRRPSTSPAECLTALAAALPAGRHRPGLDQGHPLAVAAGRHAGPAARHDPRRPRSAPSRGTRAPT